MQNVIIQRSHKMEMVFELALASLDNKSFSHQVCSWMHIGVYVYVNDQTLTRMLLKPNTSAIPILAPISNYINKLQMYIDA